MRTTRTRWLTREPAPAATARVFLLPYAGCGAGLFRNWPKERGPVDLLPVELPGRETRLGEPVPGTFQELASAMADALEPCLDVPYALFGHCWSALVAYEAAVQLQARGHAPARLFVSSQVAPQDGPVGRMLGMTDDEMAGELGTTIRALGGQPHPELVALYTRVLRADVDASRRYVVPEPVRVSCPVTAIGWTDDDEVAPASMRGWPVCGDTEFVVLDGAHHRFLDAPRELLDVLCGPLH
ncbi:thioesterase II family protein [Amycolatopsis sacchari]|uniref:thioesterase II family protein n=1 Tax=Amycolatopsis sacchari TaxID=115433 RepID=UPI003D70CD8D